MSSTLCGTPRLWRFSTVALLLSCAAAAASPREQTVTFDPARTTVDFTLGDVLHTVHGAFRLKSGVIHFDLETGKASGSIVVDAKSGASGSAARDARMHKNILESDRYSEIVFMPDRMNGKLSIQGTSQIQVHGLFRIHGMDHETTLIFLVQTEQGQVTAATSFSLPYVAWGMKNPSTFLLKVSPTVDIGIRAAGRLSEEHP